MDALTPGRGAWEEWTPARAQQALIASVAGSNRPIRSQVVGRYARIMSEGLWRRTPEPVMIGMHDEIIDGQHRLSAVLRSGVATTFWTVRGVDPALFRVIGCGIPRLNSDSVAMEFGLNANVAKTVASCARKVFWYERGAAWWLVNNALTLQYEEVRGVVERHPSIVDAAHRDAGRRLASTGTFVFLDFAAVDRERAASFLSGVEHGESLSLHDPRYVLRERIMAERASTRKATQDAMSAMTVKAWNAWQAGEDVGLLKWAHEREAFPIPEGLRLERKVKE